MSSLMPRLSNVASPAFTIVFQSVRFSPARKASSYRKVVWTKQNSSKRPSVGKVNEALRCVKTALEGIDASAQPCKAVKPRRMWSAFFVQKKDILNPQLAQEIACFATTLLHDLEKIPAQSRMRRNTNRWVVTFQCPPLEEEEDMRNITSLYRGSLQERRHKRMLTCNAKKTFVSLFALRNQSI